MKIKYSALLLATTLLAAPAWVMAQQKAAEQPAEAAPASHQHKMQRSNHGESITDKALKEATLEKVAADQKLKQLRIKQLQDLLTKAAK